MEKPKQHFYLIDNLDTARADMISRGLKAVSSIESVGVDVGQGIVNVVSKGNPDEHVRVACDVAGTVIRTNLKKRQGH